MPTSARMRGWVWLASLILLAGCVAPPNESGHLSGDAQVAAKYTFNYTAPSMEGPWFVILYFEWAGETECEFDWGFRNAETDGPSRNILAFFRNWTNPQPYLLRYTGIGDSEIGSITLMGQTQPISLGSDSWSAADFRFWGKNGTFAPQTIVVLGSSNRAPDQADHRGLEYGMVCESSPTQTQMMQGSGFGTRTARHFDQGVSLHTGALSTQRSAGFSYHAESGLFGFLQSFETGTFRAAGPDGRSNEVTGNPLIGGPGTWTFLADRTASSDAEFAFYLMDARPAFESG